MIRLQHVALLTTVAILFDSAAPTVFEHPLHSWQFSESGNRNFVRQPKLRLACGKPDEPKCPSPEDERDEKTKK